MNQANTRQPPHACRSDRRAPPKPYFVSGARNPSYPGVSDDRTEMSVARYPALIQDGEGLRTVVRSGYIPITDVFLAICSSSFGSVVVVPVHGLGQASATRPRRGRCGAGRPGQGAESAVKDAHFTTSNLACAAARPQGGKHGPNERSVAMDLGVLLFPCVTGWRRAARQGYPIYRSEPAARRLSRARRRK